MYRGQGGRIVGGPPEHRRAGQGVERTRSRTCRSTSTGSSRLAGLTAERLGLPRTRSSVSRSPASSMTSARWPSPTRCSTSRRASTSMSGSSCARHTVIGERIVRSAPSLAPHREADPLEPRALRRRRLPGQPERRRDPHRIEHHRRLRRVPRNVCRPPLPRGDQRGRGGRRAAPLLGHAVPPGRRRGVLLARGVGLPLEGLVAAQ